MPANGERPTGDGDDQRRDADRDGSADLVDAPPWDLARRITSGMPTYPDDPDVTLVPHATIEADGYRVTRVTFGSHAGTHVDAPAHTEPDGATIDEVPVERFRLEAVRIDLADGIGPREPIVPDDLPDPLPDADLLAIRTGWATHWGEPRYRDHPYLAPETARRLSDAGLGVGLDCLSPDPTPPPDGAWSWAEATNDDDPDRSATGAVGDADAGPPSTESEPDGVPAHHALLGAELPVIENLRNLGSVPGRFDLHAYPLPIADGDGAPVRAVAWPR